VARAKKNSVLGNTDRKRIGGVRGPTLIGGGGGCTYERKVMDMEGARVSEELAHNDKAGG